MNQLIKYRNNQLNAGLNGRCGWICRKLDALKGLVSGIPIIGSTVGNFIDEVQKGIALVDDNVLKIGEMQAKGSYATLLPQYQNTVSYEPTASESVLLDAFSTKFGVFFKAISTQLSAAFANNNFDFQLQQINDVIAKMCVVKQHFSNKETAGLSTAAIALRNEFITTSFKLLDDLIASSVGKYETRINKQTYTYTLPSNGQAAFGLLMSFREASQTYSCQRYVATDIPNPNSGLNPTTTVPGTVAPSTPISVNPNTQVPGEPGSSTPSETKSKLTLGNILLGTSILLTIYQLTKDEKKENK